MTDNELIYLTKTENLHHAKKKLNDKYLMYLNNLTNKLDGNICKKWTDGKYDNLSQAYIIFNECLDTSPIKSDYDFGKKLTMTCKSSFLNGVRKVMTNKRCILDKSISDCDLFKINHSSIGANDTAQIELVNEYKFQMVNNFLEKKPPIMKQIIDLKLLDFGWDEISLKLRQSKKKVQNLFNHFVMSFRKKYKNQIKQIDA